MSCSLFSTAVLHIIYNEHIPFLFIFWINQFNFLKEGFFPILTKMIKDLGPSVYGTRSGEILSQLQDSTIIKIVY